MKKLNLLLTFSLFITGSSFFAQVGINTTNPKGTFHVDAGKDNPAAPDDPDATQQLNDVVVAPSGSMGIGTVIPGAKLHINSATPGAIIINDGTQGQGKVLTSDGSGIGTWTNVPVYQTTVMGDYTSATEKKASLNNGFDDGGGPTNFPIYSGIQITLPKGKWALSAGLAFKNAGISNSFWQHAYLSTSTTSVVRNGFTHLGPATTNTAYAGFMLGTASLPNPNNKGFISGTSIIDVTAASGVTIYLILENRSPVNAFTFDPFMPENYFYAFPIN